MISRFSRLLLFPLLPILLFGGCALGKVAVQTPDTSAPPSLKLPAYPASDAKLLSHAPPPVAAYPPPSPVPTIAKEVQSSPPAAYEEKQPQGKLERYLKLPAVSEVDYRMSIYSDKLSRWKALAEQTVDLGLVDQRNARWPECFIELEQLFEGYSRLSEEVLKQDVPMTREDALDIDPWQLYYDDIAYLEGGCDQVYLDTSVLVTGMEKRQTEAQAQELEANVGEYFEKGLYDEAVQAFRMLRNETPGHDFNEETRRMYGLALLKTGQLDEAGRELSKVMESMSSSPAKRSLRRLVADLYFASGRLDEAYANYRQLIDYYESGKGDDRWVADQLALLGIKNLKEAPELPLYLEVLQDYINFDGRRIPRGMRAKVERLEKSYPDSPLTVRSRDMLGQIEDSQQEWLKGELDRVDQFLVAHDFAKAKSRLELLLADDLGPPASDLVQHIMDNAARAEQQYIAEQRLAEGQNQGEKWDRAVSMLDSGKYDQAISEFTVLFNTVYDVPAREKIREAMESAATQARRQAANLFVKARKAESLEEKKKFLEESWSLLSKIITSYPQVTIIDKVRQNLALIEKQIVQLDPVMLQNLKGTSAGFDSDSVERQLIPSTDFH